MKKNYWLNILKLRKNVDINSIKMFEACLEYHSKLTPTIRSELVKWPTYYDYWNYLVKYERVKTFNITTSLDKIKIVGDYITSPVKNENNEKTIFILHGITNTRFWIFKQAYEFLKIGYHVVLYDARNHGESDSAATTFGKNEASDLQDVINFIDEKFTLKKIILYGYSLGGSTILMWSKNHQKYEVNQKVKLIICDAAFSRLEKTYTDKINNHVYLPTTLMLHLLKWQLKKNTGTTDLTILQPIRYLKYLSKIPVIFIHGTNDLFIKYTHSQELYEEKIRYENPRISKFFLITNAKHGQSFLLNKDDGVIIDEHCQYYDLPLITVLTNYIKKIIN